MGQKSLEKNNQRLPSLTLGSVLQIVAALLWLVQAYILASAIGFMSTGIVTSFSILSSAILIGILGLVRYALEAYGIRLNFLNARQNLTQQRYKTLKALSLRSPLDKSCPVSGAIASVLTEQAEMTVPYLSRYQSVLLKVIIVPWIILFVVFFYSWLAALMLLCVVPLIPIFTRLIGFNAQNASQKQILEIGMMNGFLLDRLRGLATIRAFNAVDITSERLAQAAHTVQQKTMSVLKIAFLSSAVIELFSSIGIAMVACYVGFHLLGQDLQFGIWSGRLTLAQGMFILLLTPAFFEPLRELSTAWHERASGMAAMIAMEQLEEQGLSLVGNNYFIKQDKEPLMGTNDNSLSVNIHDVNFHYPETSMKIFEHFNLEIAAGEIVAVTAPSGTGKSTLLALLAGLLPADQGCIEIGGVALNHETANLLRSRMGWIGQSSYVFSDSLLNNITMRRERVSEAQVKSALSISALMHLKGLPLDRHMGEGGVGLSGGELLRMALARAMLTPELGLLLVDEPTAHLDAITAKEVMQGLLAVAKQGVTLIIATHDERLFPLMDRVIPLPLRNLHDL